MTDAPELEKLFDPIRKAMADMEAERLRFGYIAATIRVNAMRHGATDEQVENFLTGKEDFIGWLDEKLTTRLATPTDTQVRQSEKVKELSFALAFYGDPKTYQSDAHYAYERFPIFDDCGALARAVLDQIGGGND